VKQPSAKEIAARIQEHIRRSPEPGAIGPPSCWASHGWVYMSCVPSYRGHSPVTRAEAERYLVWLDEWERRKTTEVTP